MDASGCEEGKGFLCLQVVPIPLSWSFSSFITIMKPCGTSQKAGGLARRSIRPKSSCNRIIMLNPKCAGEKKRKIRSLCRVLCQLSGLSKKIFSARQLKYWVFKRIKRQPVCFGCLILLRPLKTPVFIHILGVSQLNQSACSTRYPDNIQTIPLDKGAGLVLLLPLCTHTALPKACQVLLFGLHSACS